MRIGFLPFLKKVVPAKDNQMKATCAWCQDLAARKAELELDEARAQAELSGVRKAVRVMTEAYDLRGVTTRRLAEMLGYPPEDLPGLDVIANAIYDAAMADPEKARKELLETIRIVEERVRREFQEKEGKGST
jgi:hypothetical protein